MSWKVTDHHHLSTYHLCPLWWGCSDLKGHLHFIKHGAVHCGLWHICTHVPSPLLLLIISENQSPKAYLGSCHGTHAPNLFQSSLTPLWSLLPPTLKSPYTKDKVNNPPKGRIPKVGWIKYCLRIPYRETIWGIIDRILQLWRILTHIYFLQCNSNIHWYTYTMHTKLDYCQTALCGSRGSSHTLEPEGCTFIIFFWCFLHWQWWLTVTVPSLTVFTTWLVLYIARLA